MRVLVCALFIIGGCGGAETGTEPTKASKEVAEPTPSPTPEEKAAPEPAPPPPTGAIADGSRLFVQVCDEANPCPSLVQPEGEKHCAALKLGDLDGWRLPDRAEAERFARLDGLAQLEGYHWTQSEFDQDASQVWIVDPKSNQPTTVPRDRKPFTIRCVREP